MFLPHDAIQSAVLRWQVIRPSVCYIEVPWSHKVKYFGNNICILGFLLFTDSIMTNLLQRKHAKMFGQNGGGYGKRWLLAYKSSNISETGHCRNKVTIEDQ